jgi:hypothetical protein
LSDSKRPGGRDISELKARLGLKKTGAPARAGGVQTTPPPPGVSLPPPPGAQPPAPVMPNAAEDPFAAMNAMAHIGAVQRAPEIIIVNDGKPVEDVSSGARAAQIGKYAGILLLPLILGLVLGQAIKSAKFYNDGQRGARALLANIKGIKGELAELEQLLDASRKSGFKADKNLTGKLEPIVKKLEINSEVVFRTNQGSLNPEIAGEVLGFYSSVSEVHSLLGEHLAAAKQDDQALDAAKKAGDDAKPSADENPRLAEVTRYRYGVVVSAPTEADPGASFGARLVELGPMFCGDAKFTGTDCGDAVKLGYRNETGASWAKGDVASPGESIPPKQIITLLPNGTIDALVRGSTPGAAEVVYSRRLEALSRRMADLIKLANSVETKLNAQASRGDKFTFFL